MPDLLTDDERKALALTAELTTLVCGKVIARGEGYLGDTTEFVAHIHDIQRMIMSQAAGRAYPDQYRLLGETFQVEKEPKPSQSQTWRDALDIERMRAGLHPIYSEGDYRVDCFTGAATGWRITRQRDGLTTRGRTKAEAWINMAEVIAQERANSARDTREPG